MKLSFSTNGWNDFSFEQYCDFAFEHGFSGIEIHDIMQEKYVGEGAPFHKAMLPRTTRKLAKMKLEIACIDSVSNLGDPSLVEANRESVKAQIELSARIGCRCIRIYASAIDGIELSSQEDAVRAVLDFCVPAAQGKDIVLVIETIGIYADTFRLKNLLDSYSSDNLGALWDFHHPYRDCNEKAKDTIKNLGAYINHVHIKDSEIVDGLVSYCLLGEGTMPVASMMNALYSINYDGCCSCEWLPSWSDVFDDADIVFPHFVNTMDCYKPVRFKRRLQDNVRHTGKFVWKKDELIDCTFPQVLDRMVDEFPDQYAFRYTTLDYTRTYSEFRDDVDTFARALISLGVKQGDHVAIWASNVPQWYITFWATTKIGAVLITVNTAYKIHEAEYLLRQSDTHTLIMIEGYRDSNYSEIINELCPELASSKPGKPLHSCRLPFLRNVITVSFRQKGCLTWEEAVEYSKKTPIEEVWRRASAIDPNDVCNMQYTSGTTGFPKGVMLTHYNIVNNGKCIGDRMDLSTADRMMIQVPMFHCFGMVLAMTATMTHGGTLLPLPYFSPKPALACINQERITAFHGVPTMFIALLQHEDFPKTDFSYMRTGIMAGSPCPEPVMRDVVEKMHMSEITIVYGQTEASPGCTMSSTHDPLDVRVSTVGRAMPEIECKIIDPATGKDLPNGVNGEFVARGYNIMKGYYKMPEETAGAIDSHGWLHTGDIACRMEDGNYKITGRLKDMIIRGGENIYPKEIEEFIYTHPKVKDVQVIGVPDEQYGEEIMACVILKDGAEMTADEMKAYVRDHMARHKVPRYVDFLTEFPMNVAGKIRKDIMRDNAAKKLGIKKYDTIVTQ